MPVVIQSHSTSPNEVLLEWSLNVDNVVRLSLIRDGEDVATLSNDDRSFADASLNPNTRYVYHLVLEKADGTRSFHRSRVATLAFPPKLVRQMGTHSTGFQLPIGDERNPDYTEYEVSLSIPRLRYLPGIDWATSLSDWSTSKCRTFDDLRPGVIYELKVVARNLDGYVTEPANQYAEDYRGAELTSSVSEPAVHTWGRSGTQDTWVKDRIRVAGLAFGLTDAALEWMNNDIHIDWRRGQPGWAGYLHGYVGIGHSFLGTMMHESMHAFWEYWKGFPDSCDRMNVYTFRRDVAQFALDFRALDKTRPNHHLAPWRLYYNLIEGFLASTPLDGEDYWEVLERGEYGKFGGVWHLLETTIPGYNPHHPSLIPPPFRKYFSGFLEDGGDRTWEEELTWFIALEDEDRRLWSLFNTHDFHHHTPREPNYPSRTRIPEPLRTVLRSADRRMLVDFINTLEDHDPWEWWVDSRGFWTSYLETHLYRLPIYKAELTSEVRIELEQPNLDAVLAALQLLYDHHCQLGEFCSFVHGTDVRFVIEQTRAAIGVLEPLSEKQRAILLAMVDLR